MHPVEITKGIYQIQAEKPSSHIYLIRSQAKNVLVDSGTNTAFESIKDALARLGLDPWAIHLVINTHEHFDHIGANSHFAETAIIAAHRLASTKIDVGTSM